MNHGQLTCRSTIHIAQNLPEQRPDKARFTELEEDTGIQSMDKGLAGVLKGKRQAVVVGAMRPH